MVLSDVVANMRDPGGLVTSDGSVVCPRRLLRSAALIDLDEPRASAVVDELGACHYFDLRSEWEVRRDGGMELFEARGWQWHRLPIQEDEAELCQRLRHLQSMPRYVEVARRILWTLSGEDPKRFRSGIVSCSLGKDRTGVVMALILQWLGVRSADIAADCAASNDCMVVQRHLLPRRWRAPEHPIAEADAEACLAAIEGVSLEPLSPGLRAAWVRSAHDARQSDPAIGSPRP